MAEKGTQVNDVDDLVTAMIKGDPAETVDLATVTAMAQAALTAGWRAPLEPEPNEKWPYGWSENRATCRRRGHRLAGIKSSDPDAPCWDCRHRKQQANCTHERTIERWSALLGVRYECAICGKRMPDPDEAEETDG